MFAGGLGFQVGLRELIGGKRHNGAVPNAQASALGSIRNETAVFRNWVGRVPSPLIASIRDPFRYVRRCGQPFACWCCSWCSRSF
jgi:hypothetical protein